MHSYAAALSSEDWLIADHDEEDIERQAVETRQRYLRADVTVVPLEVSALRRIDQLQIDGTYEEERKRLKDAVTAEKAAYVPDAGMVRLVDKLKDMPDFDAKLRNLWLGSKSSDPSQRARFQALVEKERLEERPVLDYWHLINVLEPAKKSAGRRARGSPSKADAALLQIMKHKCCCEGVSIPKAAKQVAGSVKKHGAESVAKRLEMAYRKKMALRDWPPVVPVK